MDSESVFANLDYLGSSGIVLSVEQRASLQSSLVTLKREHKFRRVKLWGIIRGIQSDYFIVQGVGKDEIKDRKALFRYTISRITNNRGMYHLFPGNYFLCQVPCIYMFISPIFSSQDCMLWSLLPYADQGLKSKSALLQGRFTGDPSFEYEHSVTHRVGEGDSAQEQTTAVSLQQDGSLSITLI